MKKIIITFLSVSFFYYLFGVNMNNSKPLPYQSPAYVILAGDIRANVAKHLAKKYNMDVVGIGGGMADSVNILTISFKIYEPLTQERARIILIDCVKELISAIDENEEIRPHLKNYPFLPENVEIGLFAFDKNEYQVDHPYICYAGAINNKLVYRTKDKTTEYGYLTQITESFEEAVKKINHN